MKELKNSIELIKEGIQSAADLLYKQQNADGMTKMNQLLLELSNFTVILSQSIQAGNLSFDIKRYMGILSDAMKAMESSDYTLVADILQYDLLEQINELEEIIE